jgi:hypothetical protein
MKYDVVNEIVEITKDYRFLSLGNMWDQDDKMQAKSMWMH